MDREDRLRPPAYRKAGRVLRIIGPLVLLLGLLLTAIGFGTVILGDPFEHKLMAALSFVGMPLMFVGSVMCMAGFLGVVTRYQAGEVAPVATDTFNYMAEGTRDGVRHVAGAIRAGLSGETPASRPCPACGHANDAEAAFCDDCGKPLPHPRVCPACDTANDPDARYCDRCGRALD